MHEGHLECMARAMNKGGIYMLGIHLEPNECPPMQEKAGQHDEEIWS